MLWYLLLVGLVALPLGSCGGKGPPAAAPEKVDLDADPLALLPGSAVVLANVDARAIFDSGSVGAQAGAMVTSLVPLREDAGFEPKRDVDRITIASYATGGVDVAAVLSGRFDPAKIDAATRTSGGAGLVPGLYAGRTTYTMGAVVFAVLTPKTAVAGTSDALRRLLDRLAVGPLQRSMPPWMQETLETKGAQVAVAADFETQPVASATVGSIGMGWLKGMRVARLIGNFAPPGMNVAATLTYGDSQQTQAAATALQFVDAWLLRIGPLLGGLQLQNLQVTTEANDLRCKFAVDDQTLRTALAVTSRYLQASP